MTSLTISQMDGPRGPQWGCLSSERHHKDVFDFSVETGCSIHHQRQAGGSSTAQQRGSTYITQQQRRYAQMCAKLLKVIEPLFDIHQGAEQPQQRILGSLTCLARRATASAEAGDSRGVTAAVVAFLRDYRVALSTTDAYHMQQRAGGADRRDATEAARASLLLIVAQCRCSTTANSAELMVQRQALGCVATVFRANPQLGSSGSAAMGEALAAAAAAAVAVHRVLGSEPCPRTDRGLQRYVKQQQQQQQHFLALGLASAQPKHVALIRALLLSINSLLSDLARARSATSPHNAERRGLCTAADAAGLPASAAAPLGAEGELSIELLLLLLPLALAQPLAASPATLQQPRQLRNTAAAAGWGSSCGLTTDFASTQESDADGSKRRDSPVTAAASCAARHLPAGFSWRRGPASRAVGSCLSVRASCSEEEAPSAATDAGYRSPSVRVECLRCIEGLLRLCGRELLPYWGLLLRCRRPPLLPPSLPGWSAEGCRLFRSGAPSAATQAPGDSRMRGALPQRQPETAALAAAAETRATDEWLYRLLGLERTEQLELPWSSLVTSSEGPKVGLEEPLGICKTSCSVHTRV